MSLSRSLSAAVEPLTHARPGDAPLPCDLTAEHGGESLTLHLTAVGPVGLAFDALDYHAADRADRPADALRAWADRLTGRLTYLMEPLIVLEHDRDGGELEMRSRVPDLRNGRRTYYEARLWGEGRMRLTRVSYDEATRTRATVPCQMTLEAAERLADDLSACAG